MSYPRALSLHLRMRSAVKARRSEQRRRTWRSSLSACPSIETRRRSERRRTHSYTAAATAIAYPVGFPKSTSCCTRYHPERGPAMPRRHSRIHKLSPVADVAAVFEPVCDSGEQGCSGVQRMADARTAWQARRYATRRPIAAEIVPRSLQSSVAENFAVGAVMLQ